MKVIFALLIFTISFVSFSQNDDKIKVTAEYVLKKNTPYPKAYNDYFVSKLEFKLNDVEFIFTADSTFKQWEIIRNDMVAGSVYLDEDPKSWSKWMFDYGEGDSVEVNFGDYNDPRLLYIISGKETYTMTNGEPDCNSYFWLYKGREESEYDLESANDIGMGQASHLCAKANWFFEVWGKKMNDQMVASYFFAAVVALNVRGFQ